jgi:hypothetical protein
MAFLNGIPIRLEAVEGGTKTGLEGAAARAEPQKEPATA